MKIATNKVQIIMTKKEIEMLEEAHKLIEEIQIALEEYDGYPVDIEDVYNWLADDKGTSDNVELVISC